jgi:amino acid transporter
MLVISIYVLATLAVRQSGIDTSTFKEGDFPKVGEMLGGRWLGMLIAAGGMASTLGLYSAVLLSVSRVPKVMADDRLLPSWLCAEHSRWGTPYISIIASSAVVSILVLFTFSDLVVMDIILYGAGLTLEFITLLIFRRKEPLRHRPFKIPLNNTGLLAMILLPIGVYAIALTGALLTSDKMLFPIALALAMLFSAGLAWLFVLWRNPGLRSDPIG